MVDWWIGGLVSVDWWVGRFGRVTERPEAFEVGWQAGWLAGVEAGSIEQVDLGLGGLVEGWLAVRGAEA